MIDLDFTLRRGRFGLRVRLRSDAQVTGLFGPSGSGKSTLLYALAGIVAPSAGRVAAAGRVFSDTARGVWLPPERRRVGMVFQDNLLFPHLDVRGNLLFGQRRQPAPRRAPLGEVADLLGLGGLLDKPTGALSGGEARRVAIGRALLASPDLLLLDEPLTGLDRRLRDRILAYLIRLKRKLGIRMVYVSHSYADLAALADRMALAETAEEAGGGRSSRVERIAPPAAFFEQAEALAGAGPVETVFRGEVVAVDRASGFATVRADGLAFHAPLEGLAAGMRAVVTLRADEVILASGGVPRTSARNVWSGTVTRIHRFETRTVVDVDVGPTIRAEVTEDAVRDLGLAEGGRVHALVKTRSLRVTALPAGVRIDGAGGV